MNWRKSSRSSDSADCVEVAPSGSEVAVRDSKDPGGPVLTYGVRQWSDFIHEVRSGTFDRPGVTQ